VGNKLEFDLYQKPTNVNRYLNFKSNHHIRSKLAVIDSLVLRCFLLSNEKCHQRINDIIVNLVKNDYPKDLVMKRIKYLSNKRLQKDKIEKVEDFEHTVCLPYIPIISAKIGAVFKKFNTRVSFSRLRQDLYSKLYNHKSKIPEDLKNGVYRIDCTGCSKCYIGETKRYLKVRKKEHELAVKNKKTEISPIAEHCINENHSIDWVNAKVITKCETDFERKFNEAIEIRKVGERNLMNRNLGENIPYVWHKYFKKV